MTRLAFRRAPASYDETFVETMADQPPPCWERDLPSLLASCDTRSLVVSEDEQEKAALLYALEHGRPTRGSTLCIMFAGFRPGANASRLRGLLAEALRGTQSDVTVVAGLEPIDSRLAQLLREMGFRQTRPAHNMRRDL